MLYENRILKMANSEPINLSLEDHFKIFGYEIIASNTPKFNDSIKKNAIEILKHFSQCSDILLFIQSALSRESFNLKYSLSPPYTTSNLDCDYILKKLVDVNLLNDYFFSSVSKSYRIDVKKSTEHNLNSILCIGLFSLLTDLSIKDILINACIKKKSGEYIAADLVCSVKNKILLFNFELASGLEKDVTCHSKQLRRLSNKVLQTYTIENSNIKELFIVSQHCKTLLPEYNCVIPINNIAEYINQITS